MVPRKGRLAPDPRMGLSPNLWLQTALKLWAQAFNPDSGPHSMPGHCPSSEPSHLFPAASESLEVAQGCWPCRNPQPSTGPLIGSGAPSWSTEEGKPHHLSRWNKPTGKGVSAGLWVQAGGPSQALLGTPQGLNLFWEQRKLKLLWADLKGSQP